MTWNHALRAAAMAALAALLIQAADDAPKKQPSMDVASKGEGKRKGPPRPPRPGVKEVQKPMSELMPVAVFEAPGVPDWLAATEDAVWVSNKPKNTVHRMDIKTNKVTAVVTVGDKPCSGLTAGFGSIWVPNCGDQTMSRVDQKTNKVVATIPVGPANTEGGVTVSKDAVWMLTDPKGVLSRIDPKTNQVAASITVPAGSFSAQFGEGAVWVTSTETSQVVRVDPKTNMVTDTISVGPQPRFFTVGGGAVWTLNQGDGTVTRIDAKTRKVVATIQAGIPGGGGEVSYGGGYVWITVFQIPLTKIDAKTDKVVAQWVGPGGDAVRYAHGSVWLSNLREQNVWRLTPPR